MEWKGSTFNSPEMSSTFSCFCDDSYDGIPVKICCVDAAKNSWNRYLEIVSVPKAIGIQYTGWRHSPNTSAREYHGKNWESGGSRRLLPVQH